LSRFEKLEKLIIRIVITNSNIEIANLFNPKANGLIWIGNNCKRLRHLNIRLICSHADILKNKNFAQIFSSFIALEKLTLSLLFSEQIIFNIEPLKNCKKFKYFELNINYLNEKTFENIELFLPKLQIIIAKLGVNFKTNSEIFKNLAKSKSLTNCYCSRLLFRNN
jgi:hypothetical protein